MTPRSPAPSMRPPAIALLSRFKRAPGRRPLAPPRPDLAHGTRHDAEAGYPEGSDTRLRAYGHGAAGRKRPTGVLTASTKARAGRRTTARAAPAGRSAAPRCGVHEEIRTYQVVMVLFS